MKTYLVKYVIWEGEHTYNGALLVEAHNDTAALALAKAQEHGPTILDEDEESPFWDVGDGTTAAAVKHMTAVTPQEAGMILRLGLAEYLPYKKWVRCLDNSTFEECLTVGKCYEVEVEKDGGGPGMDMYSLADDNGEPLNTLSSRFAE